MGTKKEEKENEDSILPEKGKKEERYFISQEGG